MGAGYVGEWAAICTALMFTLGSVLFTFASHNLSSMLLNQGRLVLSLLFVLVLHWLVLGVPLPQEVTLPQWFWLGSSGFLGLALGDASLIQAYRLIGPRISTLIFATSPVFSAAIAWIFLDENLVSREIAGIALVILGVSIVITERQDNTADTDPGIRTRIYVIGLLFAIGGAVGQALGLVTAKVVLAEDYPPLSALIIRLAVALVSVWVFALFRGEAGASIREFLAKPKGAAYLSLGSFVGPGIGVWFSLIAIQNAPIGIASTLMSLTPIFLIPASYVIFKEAVSLQSIVGTLVAFVGTAMLFI